MPALTILHVSDLHFYHREGTTGLPENLDMLVHGQITWGGLDFVSSHDLAVADAVASFAYTNRDLLDVIVVSGDLATTGLRRDLSIAYEFINGVPAPGRPYWTARFPTLRAAGKPVVLLPGNHDRYGPPLAAPRWNWSSWRDWRSAVTVDRPYECGANAFDDVFREFWDGGARVQVLWQGAAEGAALVLLAADFSLAARDAADQQPFGYLGRGRIAREQASALLERTRVARAAHPGCAVVWVIHFKPGLAADHVLRLCDDNLLAEIAAEAKAAGVVAVLCGHTHERSETGDFHGLPLYLCGTSAQCRAAAGYFVNLLTLDVDRQNNTCAVSWVPYRFDNAQGFVRA